MKELKLIPPSDPRVQTAIAPFTRSPRSTNPAGILPTLCITLDAPGRPFPVSNMFIPDRLLIRAARGIDPNK